MSYTFYLASTAHYGTQAAESLLETGFTCLGVITPAPKPQGRKRTLIPNPADSWAKNRGLPVIFIKDRITPELQDQLQTADFLLVVDFGYFVPRWLREFPKILSVNIHPSALPRYRGASPGQAVLLHGDATSAVCIMTLAQAMDAGDLLAQIPFSVDLSWTSQDYYDHAFKLACQQLPQVLTAYARRQLTLQPQQGQPSLAGKITKADTFISWENLWRPENATQIERAIRAYYPRPLAWTLVPTLNGERRLQLLQAHLDTTGQLCLDRVKLEGETAKPWDSVRGKIAT